MFRNQPVQEQNADACTQPAPGHVSRGMRPEQHSLPVRNSRAEPVDFTADCTRCKRPHTRASTGNRTVSQMVCRFSNRL